MFGWLKKKLLYKGVDMAANEAVKRTPTSWRTTLLGLGGTLAILGQVVQALFDSDPATVVDWNITIPALTASFGLLFARDQKAHNLDAPKDPSKRSGALTGVFILLFALGASQAFAQTSESISIELGASSYGTRQFAGHACLIVPLDETGSSASISCLDVRGDGNGQPITSTVSGFARRLLQKGNFSTYGLAQAGAAVSDSAASGIFNGGFCVGYYIAKIKGEAVGCGQAVKSPTIGPWEALPTIGLRFKLQ